MQKLLYRSSLRDLWLEDKVQMLQSTASLSLWQLENHPVILLSRDLHPVWDKDISKATDTFYTDIIILCGNLVRLAVNNLKF